LTLLRATVSEKMIAGELWLMKMICTRTTYTDEFWYCFTSRRCVRYKFYYRTV